MVLSPLNHEQAYLEDAVGDRLWVDDECARAFVANIFTAFPNAPLPYSEEVLAERDSLVSPRFSLTCTLGAVFVSAHTLLS